MIRSFPGKSLGRSPSKTARRVFPATGARRLKSTVSIMNESQVTESTTDDQADFLARIIAQLADDGCELLRELLGRVSQSDGVRDR